MGGVRGGSTQVAGLAHPLILPEVRYSLASLSPSPGRLPWGKHSVNSAPHSATAGSLTAYPGVRVWETLKGNSEVHVMTVLGRERRYSGTSRTQISAPYYLIHCPPIISSRTTYWLQKLGLFPIPPLSPSSPFCIQ